MLIKELPEDERPREKLAIKGSASLSNAEILAVFLRTGRKETSAIDLGREMIINNGYSRNLSRASAEEFTSVGGIGLAKAHQLASIFEFGQRLAHETLNNPFITYPEGVFEPVGKEMQCLSQESARISLLNHKRCLIQIAEVFAETGNQSFANSPRILRKATGARRWFDDPHAQSPI